ncbi:MAG TPA: hypothetical protein VG318_04360 [Actinomycetota bacterium]|nr:hypothetical protein [Actinomycetota bacterium]
MSTSCRGTTALALSLLMLASGCAGDESQPPPREPVRRERPRLEPADVEIAFRRRCFDRRECDRAGNGVFGAAARRRPPVRLTSDLSDRDPAWSPDGRRVAFARCDGADCDLWTLNVRTSTEHRVTTGPHADGDPSWSPDGNALVFQRCEPGRRARNSCELWIAGTRGGPRRRLTRNDVADGNPDWSWPLDRIVFDRGDCPSGTTSCARASVLVMRPDGTHERVLARHRYGAWEPQWDQTRPRIVYDACRNLCLRYEHDGQGSPFVVLHLRRGRRIVRSRFESAFAPSFSPGGRRLVYALRSGDDGTVTYLPLRGGRERTVYGDYYYEAFSPDWRTRS